MDQIDYMILKQLQHNAKTSIKEIASQVHLSAPAVAERVKKLEEQGVIVSLANGFTYNFSIYGIIFFIYLLSREFTSFLTGYRNQVFTAYDNRNAFVVISIPRVG